MNISLTLATGIVRMEKRFRGYRFFANCWLSVLPPPPDLSSNNTVRKNTRTHALRSMPPCYEKASVFGGNECIYDERRNVCEVGWQSVFNVIFSQ